MEREQKGKFQTDYVWELRIEKEGKKKCKLTQVWNDQSEYFINLPTGWLNDEDSMCVEKKSFYSDQRGMKWNEI